MCPLLVLGGGSFELNLLGIVVEAHDLLANAGGAAILLLVVKVKDLGAGGASPVVHDALGEDTDERRLATVDIADDRDPHIVLLAHSQRRLDLIELALKSFHLLFLLVLREYCGGLSYIFSLALLLGIDGLSDLHRVEDISKRLGLLSPGRRLFL